jgi:hypothetical protein
MFTSVFYFKKNRLFKEKEDGEASGRPWRRGAGYESELGVV